MSEPRRDKIILDHQTLTERIDRHRRAGQTIVFGNGCFDLIHVGHVRYFAGAAREGDILIIALNSDQSARTLKGPGRPAMPLNERMEVIAAIECIDYVTSFEGVDCVALIDKLRPDVHAKGTDWTDQTLPERDIVHSHGGRIAIVGDPKDHSSTALVDQIRKPKDEE